MKCPICNSQDVRRSHSQGLEIIGRYLFARKQFRCQDCNSRWAAFDFSISEDKITIAFWMGIFIFLGFLSIYLLRGGI